MNPLSNQPGPVEFNLNPFAAIAIDNFEQVANSFKSTKEKHQYLVISGSGPKTKGSAFAARNPEKAASFEQITALVKEILNEPTVQLANKQRLLDSYQVIKDKFEARKLGWFRSIFFGSKKASQLQEAKEILQTGSRDGKGTKWVGTKFDDKNNIIEGTAILFDGKEIQTGKFQNGRLIEGKKIFSDGSKEEGKYDDKDFLTGIKYNCEGGFFVGKFKEGSAEGEICLANEVKQVELDEGIILYGRFQENGKTLECGKITYPNGDVQLGLFDKNLKQFVPYCELLSSEPQKIIKIIDKNNTKIEGKVANGRFIEGKKTFSDGRVEVGKCDENGKLNGPGMKISRDGKMEIGTFESDQFMQGETFQSQEIRREVHEDGTTLHGCFRNNGTLEYGTITYPNGDVQLGAFDEKGILRRDAVLTPSYELLNFELQKISTTQESIQKNILLQETSQKGLNILNRFEQDMEKNRYYLNGQLLLTDTERKNKENRSNACGKLFKIIGYQKFKNIFHLLSQNIVTDVQKSLNNKLQEQLFPDEGKYSERIRSQHVSVPNYYITQEGDQIRLSIQLEFHIFDMTDPKTDLNDPLTMVGTVTGRRDILIPKNELSKNWGEKSSQKTGKIPIEKVLSKTKIEDYFSHLLPLVNKKKS